MPSFQYNSDLVNKPPVWRLEKPKTYFRRLKTGNADIDKVFGGIPYGLTILSGPAGTGKSRFAQEIASYVSKNTKVLYVYAESIIDALNFSVGSSENIFTANYVQSRPKWEKAIEEILYLLNYTGAEMLIIDSITTLFSETTKAVDEADIRGATFQIKEKIESKIPVIGISQIRGSGMFTYSAGGQAVDHAADLLVYFNKIQGKIVNKKLEKSSTEYIWYLTIAKDKTGIAEQASKWQIVYNDELHLIHMED